MRLVHRDRAETALPEVAGAPPARMNAPGIGAMRARQRAPQPVLVARAEDQMNMVGHQTPRPDPDPRLRAPSRQQIAIGA